jgi:hypothetical protein
MIDLLNDLLLEKQRRVRGEIQEVEAKHKKEIAYNAACYAEDIHRELIEERDYYKSLYLKQNLDYENLKRERRNMKNYVKKHFKL